MTAAKKKTLDIDSVEELLAHSLAMETEASERYIELADQMVVHHNHEVAELFRKLGDIEGGHVYHVNELSKNLQLPHIAPWEYRWEGESPEAASLADTHYLMLPYHAITLALRHEKKAYAFYADIARATKNPKVRELAEQFAGEEKEHVQWLEEWLGRFPKPGKDWAEDLDPPTTQE